MNLSRQQKINAFRELTDGAPDCFAMRVVSARYDGAVWRPVYSPLQDETIAMHLSGRVEIGTYPLIPTDTKLPDTKWLLLDFDGKEEGTDWKRDVQKALEFLLDVFDGLPVFVNISRSGQGAHVRVLFKEAVPAWMARRWANFWLEEAGIIIDPYDAKPGSVDYGSFDRVIPPQDVISDGLTFDGHRRPGNLAGCPMNGKRAKWGGTMPINPRRAAEGDFEPDGHHWEYVLEAIESRSWTKSELSDSVEEWMGPEGLKRPKVWQNKDGRIKRSLPVVRGSNGEMQMVVDFCEFFRHMRQPDTQRYELWVAMASNLHRFGDAGREMFHQISSIDPRYRPKDTDLKWKQTSDMNPVRCESLVRMGYRCPHLYDGRCNGAKAPTYFANYTYAEIL